MKTIHDLRYGHVIARLKLARQERGFTQQQLAARLSWPRTRISKIETRERRLDLIEIYDLCLVLGLEFNELKTVIEQNKE